MTDLFLKKDIQAKEGGKERTEAIFRSIQTVLPDPVIATTTLSGQLTQLLKKI